MSDEYEGSSSREDIRVINTKLDYIAEACLEFKTFIKDFDKIFTIKYDEKRKSCPGYIWCEDGIKEFKTLKQDFALHNQEHKTANEINEKTLNNRKWIIGLFGAAAVNFLFTVYKHLIGK